MRNANSIPQRNYFLARNMTFSKSKCREIYVKRRVKRQFIEIRTSPKLDSVSKPTANTVIIKKRLP